MIELRDVTNRLGSLGYTFTINTDTIVTEFCIAKVTEFITTFCNLSALPEQLKYHAIDMVCGEFLKVKKNSGQLNEKSGFDMTPVIKSITEGDTSYTYAIGDGTLTTEQKLDKLINHLIDNAKKQLTAYRRLRW
jgi:hypothetical protein